MAGVLGAMIGSFVTVVAHRVPAGESFVTGRSHCPGCHSQVAAYDNVPILSWLALRGRCRSCSEPISARYPVTEAVVAAAFVATVLSLRSAGTGEVVLGLAFVGVLAAITLTDLELRIIPNKIVAFGAIAAIVVCLGFGLGDWPSRLIGAVAGGGVFLIVTLAYPGGMGMGDVKLVAMMGLFLGSALAPAILSALVAGSAVGLATVARHGSEARKRTLAFGPFLALGGLVGLWFGADVIAWYLGLLG